MYYDTARFPFTTLLEQNWRVVRAELDALDRPRIHRLARALALRRSRLANLRALRVRPAAAGRMRSVPADGAARAADSRPDDGGLFPAGAGRAHRPALRLRGIFRLCAPAASGPGRSRRLRACGSGRKRKPGRKANVSFSTTRSEHEAWNRSDRTRTILLCDFLNPLRRRPLILNPKFTPELIGYIERDYLPTRGLGQRLLWYLWKLTNPGLVRRARANVASDRYS